MKRQTKIRIAALAGIGVVCGAVFVFLEGTAHQADPPPTTVNGVEIVVPPPLELDEGARKFAGNVCANIGEMGVGDAVREMIASTVELGGDPNAAADAILASVLLDCPEYTDQLVVQIEK